MRTESNGSAAHAADRAPTPDLDLSDFMNGLVLDVKGCLRAEREHITLHIVEKVATLLSKLVRQLAALVLMAAMVLFLALAMALYLGDLFGSLPLGLLSVAGFHLILLGVFRLWWSRGGSDRFVLHRINDLSNDEQ